MKAKLSAFISYCSLNDTTSEIIPGPFLPPDNGSFFRDMKQFGLKKGYLLSGTEDEFAEQLIQAPACCPPFASSKTLKRAIFCIWSILVPESVLVCFPKQPMSLPRWHDYIHLDRTQLRWETDGASADWPVSLPSPGICSGQLQFWCVSAQSFTKPTVYSLWATELLWKYRLAWKTEMEVQAQKKNTDKASKWKREDMEGWQEIKAFRRFFKSFRNSSSVQSYWENSPVNCFRKYLSKLILKILMTVFYLLILKK